MESVVNADVCVSTTRPVIRCPGHVTVCPDGPDPPATTVHAAPFDCFYGHTTNSKHSVPISTKTELMKALVWPVVMYGCESWTLRNNEETRLEAFEMKGLRKILRVSWTAK